MRFVKGLAVLERIEGVKMTIALHRKILVDNCFRTGSTDARVINAGMYYA